MPRKPSRNGRMSALSLAALPPGLVARARHLGAIRNRLAVAVGADAGAHIVGVNLHGSKLVVFADSPAWCTRLRYRAVELEAAAQILLGNRPEIRFRVQPPTFPQMRPARPALSASAVATLNAAARSIEKSGEDNGALAAALRRLAEPGS